MKNNRLAKKNRKIFIKNISNIEIYYLLFLILKAIIIPFSNPLIKFCQALSSQDFWFSKFVTGVNVRRWLIVLCRRFCNSFILSDNFKISCWASVLKSFATLTAIRRSACNWSQSSRSTFKKWNKWKKP